MGNTITDGSAASGTDLTTLTKVKSYLGESSTTYDTILAAIITAVSREMERVCNRHFWAANYSQWLDGSGEPYLILPELPIIYVVRACLGRTTLLNISCSDGDAVRAMVRVSDAAVTLTITGGSNAGSNTLALADYTTISTLQAAIDALAGWGAALAGDTGNYPSTDLMPIPAWDVLNTSTGLYAATDPLNGYRFDTAEGTLFRDAGVFPSGSHNVFVEYRAGYASLPDDVDMAARKLVADVHAARLRDPSLQSERLGDHSWTRAAREIVEGERDGILAPWVHWKLS